jgi:serine/threonine-protein kinase HipA
MSDEISVYVAAGEENVLAGRMYPHRHRGVESTSFVYDSRFLARLDAYALDPALPLVSGTLQTPAGHALFGAFTDSLPDRWGRTLIHRTERARAKAAGTAPRSIGEVDLLLGVRDDLRQGALRFRHGDQRPFLATEDSGVPALTDLPHCWTSPHAPSGIRRTTTTSGGCCEPGVLWAARARRHMSWTLRAALRLPSSLVRQPPIEV